MHLLVFGAIAFELLDLNQTLALACHKYSSNTLLEFLPIPPDRSAVPQSVLCSSLLVHTIQSPSFLSD